MRPGYLRENGVPHSANTKVEEDFDSLKTPKGDRWLVLTTIVTEPGSTLRDCPMLLDGIPRPARRNSWDTQGNVAQEFSNTRKRGSFVFSQIEYGVQADHFQQHQNAFGRGKISTFPAGAFQHGESAD